MSSLRPYEPPPGGGEGPRELVAWTPPPPAPATPPPGGEGPRQLWRRANAATKGTVLGVLLLLLLAGAFAAGRLTAPDASTPRAAGAAAASTTSSAPPSAAEVAAARPQDAAAKAAAQSVVAFVESCAAATSARDYTRCRTKAQLNVPSTLPLVDRGEPGAGQVAVAGTARGYRVVSVSASGNRFVVAREDAVAAVRTCTATGVAGAGCVGGTW